MTRPLRLEFPGALYHVTARGNRSSIIFRDDTDRRVWMQNVALACERHGCVIHSFCQMGNHYHVMIETRFANLARAIRHLNGAYSQYFNRRHNIVGHMFQGRYKAILVQKESYLLELSRYIVLNPLRANLVRSPENWPWSSYRYFVSKKNPLPWLERTWLLSQFGTTDAQAIPAFQAFIQAGIGKSSPLTETRHQVLLGDDAFVAQHQGTQTTIKLDETVMAARQALILALSDYQARYVNRNEAIARAYLSTAFTMPAIACHFGVSTRTVSRVVAEFEMAKLHEKG